MTRPVFKLVLTPEKGDTVDPILRLRAALKTLRRAFRLRCISVEEVEPVATGGTVNESDRKGSATDDRNRRHD